MAPAAEVFKAKTQEDRRLKAQARTMVLDAAPSVWAEIISIALGIKPASTQSRDRMLALLASRTLPELRSVEHRGGMEVKLTGDAILQALSSATEKFPQLKVLPIFAGARAIEVEEET